MISFILLFTFNFLVSFPHYKSFIPYPIYSSIHPSINLLFHHPLILSSICTLIHLSASFVHPPILSIHHSPPIIYHSPYHPFSPPITHHSFFPYITHHSSPPIPITPPVCVQRACGGVPHGHGGPPCPAVAQRGGPRGRPRRCTPGHSHRGHKGCGGTDRDCTCIDSWFHSCFYSCSVLLLLLLFWLLFLFLFIASCSLFVFLLLTLTLTFALGVTFRTCTYNEYEWHK